MKVGDLIREKEFDEMNSTGLIVKIEDLRHPEPYKVLCFTGKRSVVLSFRSDYIEHECEVISESR